MLYIYIYMYKPPKGNIFGVALLQVLNSRALSPKSWFLVPRSQPSAQAPEVSEVSEGFAPKQAYGY